MRISAAWAKSSAASAPTCGAKNLTNEGRRLARNLSTASGAPPRASRARWTKSPSSGQTSRECRIPAIARAQYAASPSTSYHHELSSCCRMSEPERCAVRVGSSTHSHRHHPQFTFPIWKRRRQGHESRHFHRRSDLPCPLGSETLARNSSNHGRARPAMRTTSSRGRPSPAWNDTIRSVTPEPHFRCATGLRYVPR